MVFIAREAQIQGRLWGRQRHRFQIVVIQIDLYGLVVLDDHFEVVLPSGHHLAAVGRGVLVRLLVVGLLRPGDTVDSLP